MKRRVTVQDALQKLAETEGKRFVKLFENGTLELELYVPKDVDPQQPHRKDEVYIVISGTGFYVNGKNRDPFGPGDFLFAEAGVLHRFEDFSEDFKVWVLFYGPDGGELKS